jgi:hypothetical protein
METDTMLNIPANTRRTTDWAKQRAMEERLRGLHYHAQALEARILALETGEKPAGVALRESLRLLIRTHHLSFSVPPKLSQSEAEKLLVTITERIHAGSLVERFA